MREIYEFRFEEEYANRLFAPDEGVRLSSSVRKIMLANDDPKLQRVHEFQKSLWDNTGQFLFFGWDIHRRYSAKELQNAELFHLKITAVFEPAGEECGTQYIEGSACPECGAGRQQQSPLRLDLRKAPKAKDIARTIADEWIVSQRLGELMIDYGLTGFELRRVLHKARYEDDPVDLELTPTGREILQRAEQAGAPFPTWQFYVWLNRPENRPLWDEARKEHAALKEERAARRHKPAPIWYQLMPTSRPVEIVPPTKTGIKPFDEDPKNEYRCPRGDLIGLNLLSELWLDRSSYDGSDVAITRQFVGVRRGLLRPTPLLLVSPKFWRLLEAEKIKGYKVEVAHFINGSPS